MLVLVVIWCAAILFAVLNASPHALAQPSPAAAYAEPIFDLSPGKKIIIKDSTFKQGSEHLELVSLPTFERLAAYLRERPHLEIQIAGYADNQGNERKNYALSLARAQAVRQFLEEHGVAPQRMNTLGFGSQYPIASNATAEGQSQNRRVEIVGLSPISRRPFTLPDGEALLPDGEITALQRSVSTFAPWGKDWLQARLQQPIYEYFKINTQARSRSEITFRDQSTLSIGENALIVLYGTLRTSEPERSQENVHVVNGSLLLKLKKLREQDTFLLKTASAQMALQHGYTKIGVDSMNSSTISVFDGRATVRLVRSGLVERAAQYVEKNTGMRISTTGIVEKKQLPATPLLLQPVTTTAISAGEVMFRWKAETAQVRFEISEQPDFTRVVFGVVTKESSSSVPLNAGTYYFRLSALDELGFESAPLEQKIVVAAQEKVRFVFHFIEFLLFVVSVALFWLSVLLANLRLRRVALVIFVLSLLIFLFRV